MSNIRISRSPLTVAMVLLAALAWAASPGSATCRAATIIVKNGQKIVFLGDSITANGWNMPGGYIHLVVSGLAAQGIRITPIPAGVSGNTSKDMLARLNRDVLSKKPNWMTLSCGVNDVWHGPITGIPLPQYRKNMTQIVDRAQAAGIHVIILTATLIGENPSYANNQKLADYNAFLRKLAVEKDCRLVDLSADEIAELKRDAHAPRLNGQHLTMDGVHPNAWGNVMFAKAILKGFAMDQQQVAAAETAWMNIPRAYPLDWRTALTLRQFDELKSMAVAKHCSINELLNKQLAKALQTLLTEKAKP